MNVALKNVGLAVIERVIRGSGAVGAAVVIGEPELMNLIPMPWALFAVPALMGLGKLLRAKWPDKKIVKLLPF